MPFSCKSFKSEMLIVLLSLFSNSLYEAEADDSLISIVLVFSPDRILLMSLGPLISGLLVCCDCDCECDCDCDWDWSLLGDINTLFAAELLLPALDVGTGTELGP